MTDLRKSSAQPRPTLAVASLLALSSRVGTQAIYDAIIDYADGLYAVDSVAIILVDGGNFRAVASRGWNKDELREVTTGPRDQDLLLLEVTAERGVPMIVEDTLKSPFWATHAALRHIRAHAAIPLALDDGVIGILCLESRVAGMVAEVHSPVLEALGLHAAVAIHNARLYEKSARRAAELALLERISARIGQNLELTELLATILDDVLQHFEGVTTGRIFLYEEGRLTWGMVFDIHSRISHLIEEPEPDSLYYRVARHVERFVIDASGLMHPIQTEEMDFAAAAVALPLAIGQRTVGVLSVHFDEIYQTNGDMLRLLRLIADQTAVAIENHLYFRRAERRGSELEFLINVLTAAAVARPISDSLVDVAKLIRVSLGAAAIAIYLPESSRGADGEEQILLHATAIDGGERTPDQVEPILVGDPNNLAGLVAKDLSPEVIDGLENQSAYLPINSQAYAVMFVPLAKGEVLAGLITIEFLVGGNPYDQDMMKLLLVLANTLPSVIQNMTLWNQLSESEKRFRQLAESVHEVFCLIDPVHHRLLYMSPAFETVWGRPMNYLLDETLDPFLETIYPDDRPGFLKQRALSVAGVTADAIELRIVRPAGDLRWIRMNIFPIENEVGQIYRLATICEDITQRKVAEEQALELVVERHKTHLLGEFITNMSHDFRTPLATINTSTYLLERTDDPGMRTKRIQVIGQQVIRLEKLLEGLLTITRLDQGIELKLVPVDLNDMLVQLEPRAQILAEARRQKVHLELSGTAMALADAIKLDQAIMNIFQNAVQFTPEGGDVILATGVTDSAAFVEVRDSGIGIEADDLPHVFDRFYRADRARGPETGGIGLGLSIARKIVELHGGSIEAESVINQGSTFRILIPRA